MIAKVLVDNISADELTSEWGLAVYIEYGDKVVLLDVGASDIFKKNAEMLSVDLTKVDAAVLSHAHADHSDGMDTFFSVNDKAKFYLRADAKEDCYKHDGFMKNRYIGIKRGFLAQFADRIEYVDGDKEILPGVHLVGHKTKGLEAIGKRARMYRKTGLFTKRDDDFAHEQSLVFETENGLVIFNSCSHGGADNIIREISETFPGKNICALVGGLHLFESTEEEVRALAARVRETGIKKIVTGHCTGEKAVGWLKEELGDVVETLCCGKIMEF